ncbi:MAG TPA: MauE/DoxX family redox-associated membrane protein, partial [Pseudonocardiaceae bacterium]|nr:MauE/DoxX family redox-associated membrane protein [Pseudonocardiaceae bacterium]
SRLTAVLAGHRLLPARWAPVLSLLLIGSELVVGVGGASAVVTWQLGGGLATAPVIAQAALYTLFFGYLIALARLRSGTDCGCSSRPVPVTGFAIGRAAVLAAAAIALPWLIAVDVQPGSPSMSQVALTWLGSVGLVAVLSVAPHALASGAPRALGGSGLPVAPVPSGAPTAPGRSKGW